MTSFGLLVLAAALLEVLTTPAATYALDGAVPQPATIVLVGVGAGAVGAAAWLKRRRKK